jgi:hypothetical protein
MKKYLFLFLFLGLGLFSLAGRAGATTISPLVLEASVNPGASEKLNLILTNETTEELFLSGSLEPFKPKGDQGAVELVDQESAGQALSWVHLGVESLALKPGEKAIVPVEINVPRTASVGGYYLAAIWSTIADPAKKDSQVKITSRVGSLILLKVNGAVKEGLKVVNFSLGNNRSWYSGLPVDFNLKMENNGNVHEKPSGFLEIKDIFGRITDSVPFNQDQKNILPQSERIFVASWGDNHKVGFWASLVNEVKNFKIGKYSARIDLEYGDNQTTVSSPEIHFWIIPLHILFVIGVILIIFLVLKLAKRKK